MTDINTPSPILIDAATGYVGSHLVQALSKQSLSLNCLVHPNAKEEDISFLQNCGAKVFRSNLDHKSKQCQEAVSHCSTAVHLIGSIAPKSGEKLQDLHKGQTEELIKMCRAAAVTKIVMITAAGCAENSPSEYHRTKWQAEELLKASGLTYVIIRPSLIIGKVTGNRDSKLISRYRKLILERPRIPLINGGKNILQPVFISDLVEALKISITTDIADNKILEIGGPNRITMHELIQEMMASLSVHKPISAIPAALTNIAACFLERIQTVPLVTRDQVKLACLDNICQQNALQDIFAISGKTPNQALASYAIGLQTESPKKNISIS